MAHTCETCTKTQNISKSLQTTVVVSSEIRRQLLNKRQWFNEANEHWQRQEEYSKDLIVCLKQAEMHLQYCKVSAITYK